ncbi:hypothetical protein CFOL_v3_12057 [Cephalotus follicularis]|uniref:Uncharacterized protein n=1 Tax=Cephalotus follicularis TaxID=3775 RepID=A0A1Q3BL17_CEPFO|nr:hypothetical protein CFOL_v3_12057 [Cephalotus follicularis]
MAIGICCFGGACKNALVMVDTIDGDGVEAWLSSCEEDMALLERDQGFLEFATPNPSVYYCEKTFFYPLIF